MRKCEYKNCDIDISDKRANARFCCRKHKGANLAMEKYYELKSDKYRIYKLVYNDEIIYIGKTTNDLEIRKKNGYTFIPFYKDCSIELVEETEDATRESYWIKYYRDQGCNLYNIRSGDGGFNLEEYNETNKEKLQEYRKTYYSNYNKMNREQLNEYRREYYKTKTMMLSVTIEAKMMLKDLKTKYNLTYTELIKRLCNEFLEKNKGE